MRKELLLPPLFLILLILSGCANKGAPAIVRGLPDRPIDPTVELKSIEEYLQPKIIEDYLKETDLQQRKRLRDRIVNARIHATDIYFHIFKADFYREGVYSNIGVDWATIALNTAGSVVGGAGIKSALSATAGGLTGAKAAFAENVYYKKTLPVIIAQMESHRKEVLVIIRRGLTKPDDEYPLFQALSDLENYYNAGTVPGAIVEIAEKAGETAGKADIELKEILKYGPDAATKRLEQFLGWDSTTYTNQENVKKLSDWLQKKGLGNIPIPSFLQAAEYGEKRLEAVQELPPK